jgi:Na+-transporting methylmalonyl-CoA/oxaloacetate decarboxylase gamma subunit
MEGVLKSDIFFFVTTITIVIVALLFVCVLIYAIRIMSDVKYISSKVKAESIEFLQDAREMRENIKEKGTSILGIISLLFNKKKKEPRKKTKDL